MIVSVAMGTVRSAVAKDSRNEADYVSHCSGPANVPGAGTACVR